MVLATGPAYFGPVVSGACVFFVLRAAFWVIAISFLINCALPRSLSRHVPKSARTSAAEVVADVGALPKFCARHQPACRTLASSVALAGRGVIDGITAMAERGKDKDKAHSPG